MSEFISFLKEQNKQSTIVVIFCVVLFSGALTLSAYSAEKVQDIVSKNRINNLEDITNLQKNHIHTLLKVRHEQVEILSSTHDVLKYKENPQQTQKFLQNIIHNTKHSQKHQYDFIAGKSKIIDMSIVDSTGTFIISTDSDLIDSKLSKQNTKNIFAYEYVFDGIHKNDHKLHTIFSHKIKNKTKDNEAVILIRTDASFLDSIADNIETLGNSGRIYVIDKDYTIINRVKGKDGNTMKAMSETAKSTQALSCFARETASTHYTNHHNIKVIGISKYVEDTDWCLVTEIDQAEFDHDTASLKATFMPVENNHSPLMGHNTWD